MSESPTEEQKEQKEEKKDTSITDEQREKLQEIFKTFDADGDGILTREELISALKTHVKVKDYKDREAYQRVINVIEEIVLIVDEDGSDTIEMEELIAAFKEELLGGAEGIVDAITKFSSWSGILIY